MCVPSPKLKECEASSSLPRCAICGVLFDRAARVLFCYNRRPLSPSYLHVYLAPHPSCICNPSLHPQMRMRARSRRPAASRRWPVRWSTTRTTMSFKGRPWGLSKMWCGTSQLTSPWRGRRELCLCCSTPRPWASKLRQISCSGWACRSCRLDRVTRMTGGWYSCTVQYPPAQHPPTT